MNLQEKFDLRVDVIRYFTENLVEDEQDLKRLAAAVTGHRWYDKRQCRGHATPFDFLRAVYFGESKEIIGIGPRGGWKTRTLGLTNALEMMTRPGIQIVHAGATLGQAKRAHEWTKRYLKTDAVNAAGVVKGVFFKKEIKLKNGSQIEVLAATLAGMNSPHPNKVRIDEFDLIKPEVIEESRMIPQTYGGFDRGLVHVSTRKFRNGNVDRLLNDRKFQNVLKLIWCVAEVVEKCPEERRGTIETHYEVEDIRDTAAPPILVKAWDNCNVCALLPDCRGQFAKGAGPVQIQDLIEEITTMDAETWNSQKRSLRVQERKGKVFDKFTRKNNVREINPVRGIPIQISVDFGGGGEGRTAALFYQELPEEIHVYAEYIGEQGSDYDTDVPAVEAILGRIFPPEQFEIGKKCVGDSASPLKIKEWNKTAKRFLLNPVRKLATKELMVAILKSLIQPASGPTRYIIHPRCKRHIEEIARFKRNSTAYDGRRFRVASFIDRGVDTVDAAIYLSLQIEGGADTRPKIWVVDVDGKRVDRSDESINASHLKGAKSEEERTLRDLSLGAKLCRLLRRGSDR